MGDYKTINGLMRHLRDDNNIQIGGSREKRKLINTGYYHGYKGYRFFVNSSLKLPFKNYAEIDATIEYDSKLKSLLYGKMMFIETALKSVALITILDNIQSSSMNDLYKYAVCGFSNSPATADKAEKRKNQKNKLNLQASLQKTISRAYNKKNPKITHFYDTPNYNDLPIWAVFEILTLGDFGNLISCLTYEVRDDLCMNLNIYSSADTNRELVHEYIYALKDLRNAIAHNDIVYDARFKKFDASAGMKQCLKQEMNFQYVNFKSLVDSTLR